MSCLTLPQQTGPGGVMSLSRRKGTGPDPLRSPAGPPPCNSMEMLVSQEMKRCPY
ncbi:hypothetical protein DPMN_122079 [Dreissena polymorpha]|uniref:Uncharacterized protein n=1 Tax=Dreissena polymorpha TaxID=45954 RepID=A0A9D4GR85_DREPO|nr:hypothetical protein DPMN_122079 [Dreissena polymorpha]